MVKPEEFMKIFWLREQGYSISAISRLTGHDRKTIRKYLKQGKDRLPKMRSRNSSSSKLDNYKSEIMELLQRNEKEYIPATVIYKQIVAKGYSGSLSLLQKWIKKYKKERFPKIVIRYETLPGEQAQVDWGEKKIRDQKSGMSKKVHIFCMTLSWSRMRFVHFVPKADMYYFLLCHKLAFRYFGGVSREILYDQNRCVLLKPGYKDVIFNKKMLDFSHHYGFLPRVCKPYRAQTKGKVENLVKYVKQNFLSIQQSNKLKVLNRKKEQWLAEVNNKVHSTTREIPSKRLPQEGLSDINRVGDYDLYYLETRKVFNDATFSFHSLRYSVPPEYIGKFITIKHRPEQNRIDVYYKEKLITQHRTDSGGWGQYVIKRSHRWEIWKYWRNEKNLFYQQAQKKKAGNHPLSIYEELIDAGASPDRSAGAEERGL